MWYTKYEGNANPKERLIEMEESFLHDLTKYSLLASSTIKDEEVPRLSRLAGLKMQAYFLTLTDLFNHMPDREGKIKLVSLLGILSFGHEERRTLGRDMVQQIDEACLAYRDLVKYFKERVVVEI